MKCRPPGRSAFTLTCVAALATAPLGAQVNQAAVFGAPRVEARLDVAAGSPFTGHAGGGVLWPIGRNVQFGVVAGAGASRLRLEASSDDHATTHEWRASARGEVVARFVIDRREPGAWRPYGVAGVGMLGVRGASPLARVFVGLGVEPDMLRPRPRPAIEVGVGGGVRAAAVLRN